jgi:hypothetical protein
MKKRTIFIVLGCIWLSALSVLIPLGYWLGPHALREIALGMFERVRPADIQHPREMSSRYFSFKYPGNWKVDTSDPDYDPDTTFDIDAPSQGSVIVQFFDPQITPQEGVDAIAEKMKKLVLNRTENPFEKWGKQKGYGIQLRGFLFAGIASIRIFGLGNSQATVVIIEMRYDEDERNNRNGYDLIAESFVWKSL